MDRSLEDRAAESCSTVKHWLEHTEDFDILYATLELKNRQYVNLVSGKDQVFRMACLSALKELSVDVSPLMQERRNGRVRKAYYALIGSRPRLVTKSLRISGDRAQVQEGLAKFVADNILLMNNMHRRHDELDLYHRGIPPDDCRVMQQWLSGVGSMYAQWAKRVGERVQQVCAADYDIRCAR